MQYGVTIAAVSYSFFLNIFHKENMFFDNILLILVNITL